jgi:aspartate racemase
MKKAIGIVGGVGPYAGLDLNKKIFDNMKTNGTDQDYLDVYLVSQSSDITDRSTYLKTKEGANPAEGLFRAALKLNNLGAAVIAIPCNTAHSFTIFDRVKELMRLAGCKAKLLNIVEETHKFLEENHSNIEKIGLLGTLGTYDTKLYENYFNKMGKFELVNPSVDGKQNVHNAIYNLDFGVKAVSSPVTLEAKQLFEKEIDSFLDNKVQSVILGCTEIPLAFNNESFYKQASLIDPTNILARALIKYSNENYLKSI